MATQEGSLHQVYSLTWQIQSQSGEIVWETQGNHALNTWWPTLTPDFCQLAAGLDSWDIADTDYSGLGKTMEPTSGGQGVEGCSSPRRRCILAGAYFFLCPRDGRSKAQAYKCGGYEKMFCAAWGCETTGDAYWNPTSSWDKIRVTRGWNRPPLEWWPNNYKGGCGGEDHSKDWGDFQCSNGTCLPLKIDFTDSGKRATEWQQGYTWGFQWYKINRGLTFKIKLKVETATHSIGPNQVLADQKSPPQLARILPPAAPHNTSLAPSTDASTSRTPITASPSRPPGTGDRLSVIQALMLTHQYQQLQQQETRDPIATLNKRLAGANHSMVKENRGMKDPRPSHIV